MRKRAHKATPQQAQAAESPSLPEPAAPAPTVAAITADAPASEQTLSRFAQAAVAYASDAIFVLNEQFRVCCFNPAVGVTLGWSAETALGRRCSEVLKCRNLNRTELCGTSACPLARALASGEALPNEELIIGALPDIAPREASVSVTPVADEQGRHAVFTARDVSGLRMANRVRSNFVSMVSHELRTPLNSVHGFIDLLMAGHMGELNEEQQKYLGYAQEGVQQLISIVEDILFMTRSDSGQFEIRPQKVNATMLARHAMISLKPQALKAEVVIEKQIATPAPLLYADPQRLKQVLNNLVTNAIKFTPPGGLVTIGARVFEGDERMALIFVRDTGSGISEEDQQHVFERFYQSNNKQQSKVGGYGLGLTIARLIVEQHGGAIWFNTEPQRGTTFYFTVPLYTGQASEGEL